ncbi:hypothetical protein JCM8097_005441 [Rhodosporidiobolus ruineniae]
MHSAISQSRGAPDPSLSDYPRPPPGSPSGIKVIIIGAGIGGLACAIECRLEGHEVIVFEQTREFKALGDNIGLFPNSGRFCKRWGIHYELSKSCAYPDGLTYRRFDGDLITHEHAVKRGASMGDSNPFKDAPLYDTTRADLHRILIERAQELGADIRMGSRVDRHFETPTSAGVEVNGERVEADVLLGADGVKSQVRENYLKINDKPLASGYAIFRTSYSTDLLRANPLCAHLAPLDEDARTIWIGPQRHFIVGTSKSGKHLHWLFTHPDDEEIEESWMLPAKIEDALKHAEGWDPVVRAVIETTPPNSLIDWKLMFREPLPRWVSDGGRVCILGDAAHPFLPTSQQGASQAVEDGVTIAHTLSLAKERGLSLDNALKAYQSLRYERVKQAQQLGVDNRDMWHKLDYTRPIDPEKIKLPFATWLWTHDAIAHAHAEFDAALAAPFPPKPRKETEKIEVKEKLAMQPVATAVAA